jgi:hypothetical protein
LTAKNGGFWLVGLFIFLIVIPGVFLVLIFSANKQYDGPNGALGSEWPRAAGGVFTPLYTIAH